MMAADEENVSRLPMAHLRLVEVIGNLPPQVDKLIVDLVDILDAELGFLELLTGNRFLVDVDYPEVLPLGGLCILFV